MPDDTTVLEIFRKPDLSTVVELLVVVALAWLAIVVTQWLLPWIGNRLRGTKRLRLLAMAPLLRLLIIAGAFIWVVPLLVRPSLQNMIALLGTVGIALGFALKDYVSALFAGVVVVGETPYRNGDWIEIDGRYGEVRRIGMRSVQIVTPDDSVITIPHSRLWTQPISNANDGSPRLMCVADFYLHPQHDAARARQALIDVALTSPYLHLQAPIQVTVHEKPWGTQYRLKAYPVDARQQFRFTTDLTVRGKAAISRLGFSFAVAPALASG